MFLNEAQWSGGLTPLLQRRGSFSGMAVSLMKVMRLSLGRGGGVTDRPGEVVGVAMGRKLLLRMDWGVKAENTGPDAASARARYGKRTQPCRKWRSNTKWRKRYNGI